ncbi:unnamed protein product, partial [Meganyctiphanes norvegica]
GMAPGTYVSRMRPRVPSGPMPPRPRQRSNSLVLNTDPIMHPRGVDGSSSTVGGVSGISNSGSSSSNCNSGINSGLSSSNSSGAGFSSSNAGGGGVVGQHAGIPQPHLLTHQTIQVRPGTPVTPGKNAIQIRQEGAGAKIITHSVAGSGSNNSINMSNNSSSGGNNLVGGVLAVAGSGPGPSGRVVGRPPLPPPTTATQQGPTGPPTGVGPTGGPLYVVTTNSGTITVVTRTVAAAGMRATAPAAVVSVGPKTVQTVRVTPQGAGGLRPMLGGTKSNVIVVHKGAPHPGTVTRPISAIPNIREPPTKITIGKAMNSSGGPMLQKQVSGGAGLRMGPPSAVAGTAPNSGSLVSAAPQSGNVIVVDMSQDQHAAAAATVAAVSVNSNSLANILTASGDNTLGGVTVSSAITSSAVTSICSSTSSNESISSINRISAVNCNSVNSISGHGALTATTTTAVSAGSGTAATALEGEWCTMEEEEEEDSGTDHSLPEGQMQMLEEAVEILGRGDKESARNLLRQAGIELLDSPGDMEHSGDNATMAGIMAGLSASSNNNNNNSSSGNTQVTVGLSSQEDGNSNRNISVQQQGATTHHQLTPVGELDPATGLFYNPNNTNIIPENIRRPEPKDDAQE